MRLTKHEYKEIMAISRWLNVDPEHLIHKILEDQIRYIREVQYDCSKKECPTRKYELAQRLRLLD